jgi:putative transferase (TIGR04331 family)
MLNLKTKVIITTALAEHNDIDGQKVYLGEWCKIYPLGKKNCDLQTIPFIWRDRAVFEKAYYYSLDVFEKSLAALSTFLNSHHNEKNDVEFYRIILSTWLIHYIQQSYDKYLSLKEAKRIYPNSVFTTTPKKHWFVPFDYTDYSNEINHKDEYNANIYSRMVSYFKFDKLEIELNTYTTQQIRFVKLISFRNHINNFISSFLSRLCFIRGKPLALIVKPYLSNLDKYKLIFSSGFRLSINDFEYPYSMDIDCINHQARNTPLNIGNNEFETYLGNTLLKDIPFLYLEGYKIFTDKIDHTATAWYYNPIFQFWYAKNKDKTKLIVQQHGGVNGTHLMAQEEIHWQVANEVWTFGWSDEPKHIPMIHYLNMVDKLSFNKKPKPKTILLAMTSQPRYICRMYSCHASTEMVTYVKDTIKLLQLLPHDVTVIIRLYPDDYGWKIRDRISENNFNCNVIFDNHKMSFIYMLGQSEIFVTDHISSCYLQSLGLNIPTVVYCNPNITKFRKSALLFLINLKELKIFHDTPESAAAHINLIYKDINKWWGNSAVKQGIAHFVDCHAHPDEKWVEQWVKRFSILKNEK